MEHSQSGWQVVGNEKQTRRQYGGGRGRGRGRGRGGGRGGGRSGYRRQNVQNPSSVDMERFIEMAHNGQFNELIQDMD